MVVIILGVIVLTASWNALRPVAAARPSLYSKALLAIGLGGFFTLVVTTQGVLTAEPWHNATILISLGGMMLAASMNAVSLSAERFQAEQLRGLRATMHVVSRCRPRSFPRSIRCLRSGSPHSQARSCPESPTHRDAAPNKGDVYVVWFSRNTDSILSSFPKTTYPDHTA